ncbi:SMP-30/gluconolactonase/LRE family protein [Marinitenerispora sediminis]|uniref:Gluconolaconase n=1 Tax=Marinitenerispora sediminis TaxID=1931232 RepID=A0A368TBT6_9ACTN|nr:SMP-30/gluconolactonase/LRE family protein [Marinitenerispora sediminis]RCV57971.1 gluconolaconase [Marinitenerispora sediminis]RCV62334.1 gluconolaconase [Marinitenerispora sediminis]RCV62572.1 gluconolaconase [Marinitenerispora sediminis]
MLCEPWSTDRFELGEGLRWQGRDLLMVDILTGRLLGLDPLVPGPAEVLATLHVPLGAVAPVLGRPGEYVAAAGTGVALLGGDSSPRWLARPEAGAAAPMRMNDGCCDPRGRFWAGSMAYDGTPGAGSVYRTDPDGTVTRVIEGYTVPNGPAFTADGARMYLADSAEGRIDAYEVSPGGEPGARTVFARVGEGSPDGMQVDAEGHLWVAVWGAGRVHRYDPGGALERVVRLPAAQPTSVCVVDTPEPRLFVASAAIGLGHAGPCDGALFSIPVDVSAPAAQPFGGHP